MDKKAPYDEGQRYLDEELRDFRAEAEEMLGIAQKKK
jgi:hypothetical protein